MTAHAAVFGLPFRGLVATYLVCRPHRVSCKHVGQRNVGVQFQNLTDDVGPLNAQLVITPELGYAASHATDSHPRVSLPFTM